LRLYAHLGQSLSTRASDTCAEWVTTYADAAFGDLAATIERLLDAYADDTAEVPRAYRRAMRLEPAFWGIRTATFPHWPVAYGGNRRGVPCWARLRAHPLNLI